MDLEKILLAIYAKLCDIEQNLKDINVSTSNLGSIDMQMMDVVSNTSETAREVSKLNFGSIYR